MSLNTKFIVKDLIHLVNIIHNLTFAIHGHNYEGDSNTWTYEGGNVQLCFIIFAKYI